MNFRLKIFLTIALATVQSFLFAQSWNFTLNRYKNPYSSKRPIENGSMFKLKDGSKISGEYIGFNNDLHLVKIITGDTLNISEDFVSRHYLPERIDYFGKQRFTYKSGYLFNAQVGVSEEHANMDFEWSKFVRPRFTLGLGIGFHLNNTFVWIPNNSFDIRVKSLPIFASSRYYLTQNKRRIYATGRAGYVFNRDVETVNNMKNGFMLEGGLGIEFSTKYQTKHYLQFTQYTSTASGSVSSFGMAQVTQATFDIWFNSFNVTYGITVGSAKPKEKS